MKKFNWFSLLLLLPFVLGLLIALNDIFGFVNHAPIYAAERSVFEALRVLNPYFDTFLKVLTELGDTIGLISVVALTLVASAFAKRFFTVGLPCGLVALVSRVINVLAKMLTDRQRPDFKTLDVSETSFPSGHAQNNMAFYLALLICLLLIVTAPKWRVVLTALLIALPTLIGISRIYLGVHYISDVCAGFGLGAFVGITFLYAYFKVYNFIKEKRNAKNQICS